MLKMFSTQLSGLLQRIHTKEEDMFEDAARLLAQAAMGEGRIYLKGFKELAAVTLEATEGAESAPYIKPLINIEAIETTDRVIIFTRLADDPEALALGKTLADAHIPFVIVAGKERNSEPELVELADVFIDTQLTRALLPTEDFDRVGFPSGIAGLYIYHAIKFTLDEIFDEFDL